MYLETFSPALAVLSLRAIKNGKKPHLSAETLCWYLMDVLHVEERCFSKLTDEDFARAKSEQRQNNKVRQARRIREAVNA